MADLERIAKELGADPSDPFAVFMAHVDDVVTKANGAGLGVFDFADADWAGLFEEIDGEECEDQMILDTLSDADDIFARIQAIRNGGSDD